MPNSSRVEAIIESASGDDGSTAEAKAAFHLRMRARGIRDLGVLRAFERVPRAFFVPERYRHLAGRDLALPIACGQTMIEPLLVARMAEALSVLPGHRVLEIGSGTGYATAILSHLAYSVTGIERFQGLAVGARARLHAMGLENASVTWGDGLAMAPAERPFDRILVHGQIETRLFMGFLADDGVVVAARTRDYDGGQMLFRLEKNSVTPNDICRCRLRPLLAGTSATL